jgi:hypothetical protein
LRPSGKFSWLALAVAGLLSALLIVVIKEVREPATGLLFSDLLQTTIVFWAGFCSLSVARQSSGYLRQLWKPTISVLFPSSR